ncbi:MAG: galactose-1-epimerase [Treponema sp.]|nr:MAG: galactose-1-epimerase [Treponema sp.]
MNIKRSEFIHFSSGETAYLYTITNGKMSFSATNYGCCITSILLPSKHNTGFDDVVLGYSTGMAYINNFPHFGSLIGRCAGRIANAEFFIDGEQYLLTPNDNGRHCLHGGYPAYDKQLWTAITQTDEENATLIFEKISYDGEQGFPGELKIIISYTLTSENEIILKYSAKTDKPTIVNFTNHSYFNLNPAGMRSDGNYVSVLNHEVQIFSNEYLELDNELIPTGKILTTENTDYDFRKPKPLSHGINNLPNGYDDTWVIKKMQDCDENCKKEKSLATIVREPITGRVLSIYSTQPGLTMYTGNFLEGELGKNGDRYSKFSGLCLETQHFPDSIHQPNFPSTILTPEKNYHEETVWHFKL